MKVQLLGLAVLGLAALTACSSEQSLMQPVALSHVESTGCKTSYSAKESRPEYYEEEREKTPKLTIAVDDKGVAAFSMTDLEFNCATERVDVRLEANDEELRLVMMPYMEDPTMEADCLCKYDAGFQLAHLASGKYHLKVYVADGFGQYNASSPLFDRWVWLKPHATMEIE